MTNVLENQLVKASTRLMDGIRRLERFKTMTEARRGTVEITSDLLAKPKQGLVVFTDDSFINH